MEALYLRREHNIRAQHNGGILKRQLDFRRDPMDQCAWMYGCMYVGGREGRGQEATKQYRSCASRSTREFSCGQQIRSSSHFGKVSSLGREPATNGGRGEQGGRVGGSAFQEERQAPTLLIEVERDLKGRG